MKPDKYKHFSKGNKYTNTLLTRIRVGRSSLNSHKFVIGHSDSPECLCNCKEESPSHYFLECFLYSLERQTLFDRIVHYIPNFLRLSKQMQLQIILQGVFIDKEEYISTNISLTIAVQRFISQTNRFEA